MPRLVLVAPFAAIAALACVVLGACLPGSGPAFLEPDEGGPGKDTDITGDSGLQRSDVDLGDPFALYGLTPSHGPYIGGTTTRLAGRGFTPKLRVFIGDQEVPTVAGDPTRAVVVTQSARTKPGFVDVRIRDDATAKERVLKDGFFYDSIVVLPSSGATSGGTRIRISNGGEPWLPKNDAGQPDTRDLIVEVGGARCTAVTSAMLVGSEKSIACNTPPGAPGSKDVVIKAPNGTILAQARDAFTYSDSPDGYRGGLAGGAFGGRMRVLAFDAATGVPIPGAFVVAGGSLSSAVVAKTASTGVAEIDGLSGTKMTITVAAKCHQPITYVDVPVDTVTAYLPFVFDISCADPSNPDPPSTGGRGGKFGGVVEGELVFPGGTEFTRTGWTNVPAPLRPTERRAAYVFEASSTPNEAFRLPAASEAITPDASGAVGYKYSLVTFPGNVSLYVVAGLEDRSETPPRFIPYSMGVARGVSVPAQTRVTGVDVKMDILFDHQVTVAPQAPLQGPRGPDRFSSTIALTFGAQSFAILPRGVQVSPYPVPATMPFIGVPSLDHGVTGEQYVLGGVAATGFDLQAPASIVSRIRTTNANDPVTLGGFIGIPVLGEPASGTWRGTRVEFSGATGSIDLTVVQITSGNGLVTWTIAAPGGLASFAVPDLSALPGPDNVGLVSGTITSTVRVGRIEAFSYGNVRQGQLSPGSWNAQAFDSLVGNYTPPPGGP